MGDLRSYFRRIQAERDARAARHAPVPRARVDDCDRQRETLAAIKLALAATPLQAYASVDPELQARQIFDASGLSGRAYEEILTVVKATVARANSPEAKAQQILDAAALARAGGHDLPAPPRGSLAAQIVEAARKNRQGEGSR